MPIRGSPYQIEQKTDEDVAFRVLSCDGHPDHSRISEFRRRHLRAISRLFVQVLCICKEAGLVKLDHVALDSPKIRASAFQHKAMRCAWMVKEERVLAREMEKPLQEGEVLDEREDKDCRNNRRGGELSQELRLEKKWLEKILEAVCALDDEAHREAKDKETCYKALETARRRGFKIVRGA